MRQATGKAVVDGNAPIRAGVVRIHRQPVRARLPVRVTYTRTMVFCSASLYEDAEREKMRTYIRMRSRHIRSQSISAHIIQGSTVCPTISNS